MKFAWQIADGMSYLSSKFVSWKKKNKKTNGKHSNLIMMYHCEAHRLGRIILWYNVISLNAYAWEVRKYSYHLVEGFSYGDPIHFQRCHLLFFFLFKLRSKGYLIHDLNCFYFLSYHFRLLIFVYYFTVIEIKPSRFLLCRHKQGREAYFSVFTINRAHTNLVPKQKRDGFHTTEFCQHLNETIQWNVYVLNE